jgi:hypothetical protein
VACKCWARMERDKGFLYEPVIRRGGTGRGTMQARFKAHVSLVYRGLRFALTWHALWMVLLTCLCTFLCSKGVLDISFNTSMIILAAGTVFPLVFSVQAGFQRRDDALDAMARLKGAMFAMYLMFRTWEKDPAGRWGWEDNAQRRWAGEVEKVYQKLLDDIELYLRSSRPAPEESGNVVYDGLVALCDVMAKFAPHSGHSKHGGQLGMGRMSCYHRDAVSSFERVRAILDTQMPVGLRLFCYALIHVSPIVLAPYWNRFCGEKMANNSGFALMESAYGCHAGYFIAITYVLILVTLSRVQRQLENPFDGDDLDDINWEIFRSHFDQLHTYGIDGRKKRARLRTLIEKMDSARFQQTPTQGVTAQLSQQPLLSPQGLSTQPYPALSSEREG